MLLSNYFVYFNALLFTIYYASIPVDGMLNRFRRSRNRNVAQPVKAHFYKIYLDKKASHVLVKLVEGGDLSRDRTVP